MKTSQGSVTCGCFAQIILFRSFPFQRTMLNGHSVSFRNQKSIRVLQRKPSKSLRPRFTRAFSNSINLLAYTQFGCEATGRSQAKSPPKPRPFFPMCQMRLKVGTTIRNPFISLCLPSTRPIDSHQSC